MAFMLTLVLFSSFAVQAQKMDQASKNIKFYGQVWDVVVNEGRVICIRHCFC